MMIPLVQIPSGIAPYSYPVVMFNSLGELVVISFNGSVQYAYDYQFSHIVFVSPCSMKLIKCCKIFALFCDYTSSCIILLYAGASVRYTEFQHTPCSCLLYTLHRPAQ